MNQVLAPVISNTEILPGVRLLWARAAEIAATAHPGQFVTVRCGEGYNAPLRRPLSIHRIGGQEAIALLFAVVGQGTRWLSRCREGEIVEILGPLGQGFEIQPTSRNLLLVAGGIGISPLFFLAESALATGRSVSLLLGGEKREQIYPTRLLPPGLKLSITTADGSAGTRGLVTDLLPDSVSGADQIFACGPTPMYRALAAMARLLPELESAQVLLEQVMGCGLGACYGCAVETKEGSKLVCKDGPVFEIGEIVWEKLIEPGIRKAG